jgi:hypothetical protein
LANISQMNGKKSFSSKKDNSIAQSLKKSIDQREMKQLIRERASMVDMNQLKNGQVPQLHHQQTPFKMRGNSDINGLSNEQSEYFT